MSHVLHPPPCPPRSDRSTKGSPNACCQICVHPIRRPMNNMPGLCPSTTNNTKTPIEYMPPLLKFCPAPTHPQQYSFQHACIQIRLQQLDSAGYRILWNPVSSVDTAGYRIQLDTLRSAAFAFSCVQPGYRSAFSCVQEPAFSCVLRSAAFCVQLRSAWIQPGVIRSFWVGILCRQGRYTWTHTCCNPSLATRNVNRVVRMHAAGFVSIYYYYHRTFGDRPMIACLPS